MEDEGFEGVTPWGVDRDGIHKCQRFSRRQKAIKAVLEGSLDRLALRWSNVWRA
jgi:hypothetical protein